MVDVLDYALAIGVHVLALSIIAASVWQQCVRRYLYLNLYAIGLLVLDGVRYIFLQRYGFTSKQYFLAFYGTDVVLVVLLYLLILSIFDMVFRDSPLRAQIRGALFGFLGLVAGMSYVFISNSVSHFYSHLLVEFQQNMYFASVVLTVLLCVSLAHLRVEDPQLGMLIAGLGVLAATQGGTYALQNLLSKDLFLKLSEFTRRMPAVSTMVMLGLWCYALVKVPVSLRAPARAVPLRTLETDATYVS